MSTEKSYGLVVVDGLSGIVHVIKVYEYMDTFPTVSFVEVSLKLLLALNVHGIFTFSL